MGCTPLTNILLPTSNIYIQKLEVLKRVENTLRCTIIPKQLVVYKNLPQTQTCSPCNLQHDQKSPTIACCTYLDSKPA